MQYCCCCLVAKSCLTLYDPMEHARLPYPSVSPGVCSKSCPLSWSVTPSNHLILCRPLLLLPSIFPGIRGFFNESALHIRRPEYSGLKRSGSQAKKRHGSTLNALHQVKKWAWKGYVLYDSNIWLLEKAKLWRQWKKSVLPGWGWGVCVGEWRTEWVEHRIFRAVKLLYMMLMVESMSLFISQNQ